VPRVTQPAHSLLECLAATTPFRWTSPSTSVREVPICRTYVVVLPGESVRVPATNVVEHACRASALWSAELR